MGVSNAIFLSMVALFRLNAVDSQPTAFPTEWPTRTPTEWPTALPTPFPTEWPTPNPTTEAPTTDIPTMTPTEEPTKQPTEFPTKSPTKAPTDKPTREPTEEPTDAPTLTPSAYPTKAPTGYPTTKGPSASPTKLPTKEPTAAPTLDPTSSPTAFPTEEPTLFPTSAPTRSPTRPTASPTRARNRGVYVVSSIGVSCAPPGVRAPNVTDVISCQAACDQDVDCTGITFSASSSCDLIVFGTCATFEAGVASAYTRISGLPPTEAPSAAPTRVTASPTTNSPTTGKPTTPNPTFELTWTPTAAYSGTAGNSDENGVSFGTALLVAALCFGSAIVLQTIAYFGMHAARARHFPDRRRYSGGEVNFGASTEQRFDYQGREDVEGLENEDGRGYAEDGEGEDYGGEERDHFEFNSSSTGPASPFHGRDLRNLGQTESILVNI